MRAREETAAKENPPTDVPGCPDPGKLLGHLLQRARSGIVLATPDGLITSVNPSFARLADCGTAACAARRVHDLFPALAAIFDLHMKAPAGQVSAECALARPDGTSRRVSVTVSSVGADTGEAISCIVFQIVDLEAQRLAEDALARNEARMDFALESAGQGVWDYDFNTREMFYSTMWRRMRGIGPDEAVDGTQEAWLVRVHPDDRDRIRELTRRQDAGEIERNAFEYRERHRDGHWMWILSRGKVVEVNPDGSPARVIGTDTDITELKAEEARRAREAEETYRQHLAKLQEAHRVAEEAQALALSLARHDALTGLANRRVFAEELEAAIARGAVDGGQHAVMIVDLDRFKPVNDLHGHAAGDAVLCEVANRLQEVTRQADNAARLGGDEFALVIDCGRPTEPAGEIAAQVATRIIDAMGRPIVHDGRTLRVGASIGIAGCPADGRDADTLLRAADLALYRAKEEGRGTFRFFQHGMEAELRAKAALEEDVRRAVADGVIEPHYQPLIRLADNRLVGFEALARWRHPVRGDVPPDTFIPVTERLGLIGELTYQLLRRACADAAGWPPAITVSLNVSPYHLADPLLPVKFLSILSEAGFPPERLEIEVTEQAVTHDIEAAQRTVRTLQELGIKVALDDFGTGYSNLSHLRRFRFDKIKIDRSFVQSMEAGEENVKLVYSMLDLARNLGLPTIAEGIEHAGTLDRIVAAGGEYGQGFYFGKAMPAAEAAALARSGGDMAEASAGARPA